MTGPQKKTRARDYELLHLCRAVEREVSMLPGDIERARSRGFAAFAHDMAAILGRFTEAHRTMRGECKTIAAAIARRDAALETDDEGDDT